MVSRKAESVLGLSTFALLLENSILGRNRTRIHLWDKGSWDGEIF